MDRYEISVIITTLNRPKEVIRLVTELDHLAAHSAVEVVIVNSGAPISELSERKAMHIRNLAEILVDRRNQPFQRWMGVRYASGRICVFMDDDLRIVKDSFLQDILEAYKEDKEVVGTGVGFVNEGSDYIYEASYPSRWSAFRSNLNYLEFDRKPGDCGIGGREPLDLTYGIRYVNALLGGNAPSCLRKFAHSLWDERIFQLADRGMGKGEDKYFTLGLARYGKIRYLNDLYLIHPTNGISTYQSSYFRWRGEVLRTRFLLCDRYSEIFRQSKAVNRVRILLGTLLASLLFIRLNRKGIKQLVYLPYVVYYSIKNTWLIKWKEI